MNITTRGRYGVKALFELALRHGEGPIALRRIAENQGLPEHYLEQLMGPLRKAELVRSVRGARGGYVLAREPGQITVGEILRVLEGPLSPVDHPESIPDAFGLPAEDAACTVRGVWRRIHQAVEQVVDSITLETLRQEELEKLSRQAYTFHI